MKRLRDLTAAILLSSLSFLFSAVCFPDTRGIQVMPKQGEPVDLYKDYCALVVGVGSYTNGWPDLPGAVRDGEEVAAALGEYGFTVKFIKNPTSREVKKALTEMAFVTGREENRAMLFYFAGHGETLNLADGTRLGYIIPSDCPLKDKDPIGFDDLAISMKEIEALALKVQCKHVLMVFDSCFSGSLFSLVRAAPVEISEKSARPVRQFITAGGEGEQVPDRSVFKQVFLEGIKSEADLNNDGYVTASELGMYLQNRVVNYSRGGQHPQYGKINNPKLDKGDFIFVPKATRQKEAAETQKAESDKIALSEELKKLQDERKKNEELLEKLKQMLETRVQVEEAQKRSVDQQKELEERLKLSEKEKKTSPAETDEKIRKMEAGQRAAEERLAREAAERKVLEEELQKIRTESRKPSQALQEMETKKPEEQVASIPREIPRPGLQKPPQPDPGLKLAIFPMYLAFPSNFKGMNPQFEQNFRDRMLKGIRIAVDGTDLFKEVFSFYEFEDRPDIQRIANDIQNREIWKRKGVFSNPEPNLGIICEEARKLGADAVFALFVDVERDSARPTAYVIDTVKKKTYTSQGAVMLGQTSVLMSILKKAFDEFQKDQDR